MCGDSYIRMLEKSERCMVDCELTCVLEKCVNLDDLNEYVKCEDKCTEACMDKCWGESG